MGGRDKDAHAVGHRQEAALDHIGHDAVQDFAAGFRLHDLIPALHRVNPLFREHDGAFLIVGAHNEQLQLIPHLDDILGVHIRIGRQLVYRDVAGLLAPDDLHLHLIGGNAHDNAAHPFVCT